MRFINNRNREPKELSNYRKTPGVTYDNFPDKTVVRQSLVDEQGYICAYCMGRIDTGMCTIEHYVSQTRHQDSPYKEAIHKRLSLQYANMCGVCINNGAHCDKHRGNIPLNILDPHKSNCETLITYELGGKSLPVKVNITVIDKEKVQKDIAILGLDCEELKKRREATWDEVLERFKREHEKKEWSKELFLEYANKYRNKQKTRKGLKFHAYCNFIVWCFEHYANNYKNL